jgi:diphthine-ammonia ligase
MAAKYSVKIMAFRVAVLFSGGKDSAYALHVAWLKGFEVTNLIILVPRSSESWMFHVPNIHWATLQAKALEIPYVKLETSGIKERELEDLKRALEISINRFDIDGVVAGALLSDYQRMRLAALCEELGLRSYTPLWRKDPERYLEELVALGISFVITRIASPGLPKSMLGKLVDRTLAQRIIELSRRYKFNPSFEGGEAETFVVDAPLFKKKIVIEDFDVLEFSEWESELVIKSAKLVDKQ